MLSRLVSAVVLCAVLGCGQSHAPGGAAPADEDGRRYVRLLDSERAVVDPFLRARSAGARPEVLELGRVVRMPLGIVIGTGELAVELPDAAEVTARPLGDDRTDLTLRVIQGTTCGVSPHARSTSVCIEPNFVPQALTAGEIWQVAMMEMNGANEGYWTLVAGRRWSDAADPEEAVADLEELWAHADD
jgi:hypothetical protein